MKYLKQIMLLLSLLITFVAMGQSYYQVKASRLNIRTSPSTTASVLGVKEQGSRVVCYGERDGWKEVEFNGHIGYASSQYLSYIGPVNQPNKEEEKKKSSFSPIDLNKLFKEYNILQNIPPIVFITIILILSIALWMLRSAEGDPRWIIGLFLGMSITEILYLISCSDPIWFCDPDEVGWIMTIIDFFIFGVVIFNQVLSLIISLFSCSSEAYADNHGWWAFGLGGWVVGVILIIIQEFFMDSDLFTWLALIYQVIFITGVTITFIKEEETLWGLCALAVYLLGCIATTILLIAFLVMLLMVLIAIFFLGALLAGGNERTVTLKDDYGNRYKLRIRD